jgi:hypothetical protein
MVDDSERFELAREAAKIALAQSTRFTRVVLASLRREMPLIDVVER